MLGHIRTSRSQCSSELSSLAVLLRHGPATESMQATGREGPRSTSQLKVRLHLCRQRAAMYAGNAAMCAGAYAENAAIDVNVAAIHAASAAIRADALAAGFAKHTAVISLPTPTHTQKTQTTAPLPSTSAAYTLTRTPGKITRARSTQRRSTPSTQTLTVSPHQKEGTSQWRSSSSKEEQSWGSRTRRGGRRRWEREREGTRRCASCWHWRRSGCSDYST
eukprot:3937821-Rhodomonas_salina.1